MTTATYTRKFYLTHRDVQMLESINVGRFMTAQGLEWLHFPTWRDRWAAAQAAGTTESYRPAPHLYRRLNHLIDHGYVYRMRRPIERSREIFGRAPDVYMLSALGAEALAVYHPDWYLEDTYSTRKRERSFQNVEHGAQIGLLYAAVRARVEQRGRRITDWQGEHLTAKSYDRVEVLKRRAGNQSRYEKMAIQPDATFVIHGRVAPDSAERVFVEIDRGTRPTQTWADKIAAYQGYWGSQKLKERYGTERFIVLTIAPTAAQRRTLMQATAVIAKQDYGFYFFALEDAVHPDTIGTAWQRIATATPGQQLLRPAITTADFRFT
jgi:hypothetical protein